MAFDNTDPVMTADEIKAHFGAVVSGTPEGMEAALQVAINRDQSPDQFQQSISSALRGNESLLVQGGYDPGVDTAVAASAGVGVSQDEIQEAAAEYTMRAAAAIRNGIPLDHVTIDPRLSAQAQQEIYENIAAQQGTSAAQIAEKAEQARQADMAAVQSLVGGAVATEAPTLAEFMGLEPKKSVVDKNPFARAIENSEHGDGLLAALAKAFGGQQQNHTAPSGGDLPASQSITGIADLGQSSGRGQG